MRKGGEIKSSFDLRKKSVEQGARERTVAQKGHGKMKGGRCASCPEEKRERHVTLGLQRSELIMIARAHAKEEKEPISCRERRVDVVAVKNGHRAEF